jgi:hypothetical protein
VVQLYQACFLLLAGFPVEQARLPASFVLWLMNPRFGLFASCQRLAQPTCDRLNCDRLKLPPARLLLLLKLHRVLHVYTPWMGANPKICSPVQKSGHYSVGHCQQIYSYS